VRAIDLLGLLLLNFLCPREGLFHVSHSQIEGQLPRVRTIQLTVEKRLTDDIIGGMAN